MSRVNRFMLHKKNLSNVKNDIPVEQTVQIDNNSPIIYEDFEYDCEGFGGVLEKPIVPEEPIACDAKVTESPETINSTHPISDEKTENFVPERTTKSLEHEVNRLTKRLQRVENTINRSTYENTLLNKVFTGQFGELVRTAVRNKDTNTLERLLDYADGRSAAKKTTETLTEAPVEQQNPQVSLQNNHELERRLESALETIKRLKMQQQGADSELQQKYSNEEESYCYKEELINTKQELSQAAENFEKMRGEIIDSHAKKMAQKDTLVAYHESKVRELQKDRVSYEEEIYGLNQKIADLTHELNTTKSVLDGIMKMVKL